MSILRTLVLLSGLIELLAGISLFGLRETHPFLRPFLQGQGASGMFIALFLGLAALFAAALHWLMFQWLKQEREEGYLLVNVYGGFATLAGLALFLGYSGLVRGQDAASSSFPAWLFLALDSLRGALLLVTANIVRYTPSTLSELRLPAGGAGQAPEIGRRTGSRERRGRPEELRRMRRGSHERATREGSGRKAASTRDRAASESPRPEREGGQAESRGERGTRRGRRGGRGARRGQAPEAQGVEAARSERRRDASGRPDIGPGMARPLPGGRSDTRPESRSDTPADAGADERLGDRSEEALREPLFSEESLETGEQASSEARSEQGRERRTRGRRGGRGRGGRRERERRRPEESAEAGERGEASGGEERSYEPGPSQEPPRERMPQRDRAEASPGDEGRIGLVEGSPLRESSVQIVRPSEFEAGRRPKRGRHSIQGALFRPREKRRVYRHLGTTEEETGGSSASRETRDSQTRDDRGSNRDAERDGNRGANGSRSSHDESSE
ncbi:MAG: hypothetical protein KBD56_04800 [Candidatus Eisenbacteria bacterium]|nr:hypothetical protein [Candidatus Eisenbacteria bacterium]